MTLLALWSRIDVRRQWRAWVVLGTLVAVATCVALASIAGARRGSSALDRLLERTLPATVVLRASQTVDLELVRALPEVAALSTFNSYTGFAIDEVPGQTVGQYVPADADAMRTIERPIVLAGRLADPNRADEAVVTERFVTSHGFGVGDTVTLRLFTQDQVKRGVSGVTSVTPPRPRGPAVPTRIVGVVRSTWFGDTVGTTGELTPSYGLFQQHRLSFVDADPAEVTLDAIVRLHGGQAAFADFRRSLDALTKRQGWQPFELDDRADEFAHVREVVRFESACLVVFGLCVLLVGGAVVGQAVARSTQRTVVELDPLRAVGLPRSQLVAIAGAVPALVAVGGAVVGGVGAVVVSAWLPFGTAGDYEPSPGPHADAGVLLGLLLVPVLVYAAAAVVAAALLYRPLPARRLGSSTLARAAAQAGLAVPIVVGIRLALEPERVRGTVLRPALGGAVLGVLGVVTATLFAAGVADAAERPERFGQRYQASLGFGYGGDDFVDPGAVMDAVERDRDVLRVVDTRYAVANAGRANVLTFGMPLDGPDELVVEQGVPPGASNEVLLAPKAAERLGAELGSALVLNGTEGERELLVTGIGFVPETDFNGYSDGAVVTSAGYRELFGSFHLIHAAFVEVRPGAELQAVSDRMYANLKGLEHLDQAFFSPVPPPPQLAEIRNVRLLPIALGMFLLVFAVSAVGHALAKAVRHRQRELGVLRALGMTPWQARGVVVAQASVLAGIGALVGVPLGVALGRSVWRMVAQLMPLAYVPPAALWVVLLSLPAALLVATLLAARPGEQAARLRLSQVLRAE